MLEKFTEEKDPVIGSDGKYHYLYIIINKINNKFYIGKHSTENLDDNYIGSGITIKRAIAKHGLDNFTKIKFEFFDSSDLAYEKEKEILTIEFVLNENCYNMITGGSGAGVGLTNHLHVAALNGRSTSTVLAEKGKHHWQNGKHPSALLKGTPKHWAKRENNKLIQNKSHHFFGVTNPVHKMNKEGKNPMKVLASKGMHPLTIAKQNGTLKMIGENHPNYKKLPWENVTATPESLGCWKVANEVYDIWKDNQLWGWMKLNNACAKIINTSLTEMPLRNMIHKFRGGWNPIEDAEWLKFKEEK